MRFLADHPCPRPWLGGRPANELEPRVLFIGKGAWPFEVVVARASAKPDLSMLQGAWSRRQGARSAELLLVVLYPAQGDWKAATVGPSQSDAVAIDVVPARLERSVRKALAAHDRHTAARIIRRSLHAIDGPA